MKIENIRRFQIHGVLQRRAATAKTRTGCVSGDGSHSAAVRRRCYAGNFGTVLNLISIYGCSISILRLHTWNCLEVQNLSARGVSLARWFMSGVEHAILANDACGAPIPAVNCCPWHFFDGKLFQVKLSAADRRASLMDLCNGSVRFSYFCEEFGYLAHIAVMIVVKRTNWL